MDLEHVYLKLPIPLQNAACTLGGWQIELGRFGGSFPELLRQFEARTFVAREEIEAVRDERLHRFVTYCGTNVPYYRRRFRELGVDPREITSLGDLKALPILTKDEVKDHHVEFRSHEPGRSRKVMVHTGGSTGAGFRFPTTVTALREQWAVWWRYRRWHGIERGTWCALFAGRSVVPITQTRPPFWRYNRAGRQIFFSAYHMSRQNVDSYLSELRRKQPPWFHGYPSLLAVLADRALETSFDLGYAVRWVTIGAENLLAHQAEVIERAFGVRPTEHYGSTEATANVSECPNGVLHVDEDFAATEFLPSATHGSSLIVGTNFTNLATPLIRYEVNDVATVPGESCRCGRPGRPVASIDGRLEDYVILRNGARLGRVDHIFKDMVNIREAQIYQRVPGEIVARVVRGPGYGPDDETRLLKEARKRLGVDTDVEVEYVDGLPRSAQGKLRMVVSDVPEGKALGGLSG
jgi:phenylacetate-coenzyme A ligase PaaK-like adenylate-forming protein